MGQAPLLVVVVVVMVVMTEILGLLPAMGLAPLLQKQKTSFSYQSENPYKRNVEILLKIRSIGESSL
ncbi:MAG: hypothetical protein LBT50_01820 [Prevotellaceae bacterium]|jgi:hypothetical protein|nr:hypothetical protein [Prevotellaceae bacterium]